MKEIKEIFEKIKSLKIDEIVYHKNENNKKELVVQIRCDNGYAEINIKPVETKIIVAEDVLFTVNDTTFRDLGKNKYRLVIDKSMTIKQIEKLIEKPVWYNGLFRKCA